ELVSLLGAARGNPPPPAPPTATKPEGGISDDDSGVIFRMMFDKRVTHPKERRGSRVGRAAPSVRRIVRGLEVRRAHHRVSGEEGLVHRAHVDVPAFALRR